MLFLILAAALMQEPTPATAPTPELTKQKFQQLTLEQKQDIQDLIDQARKIQVEAKAKGDMVSQLLDTKLARIEKDHPGYTIDPTTLNLVIKRQPTQEHQRTQEEMQKELQSHPSFNPHANDKKLVPATPATPIPAKK